MTVEDRAISRAAAFSPLPGGERPVPRGQVSWAGIENTGLRACCQLPCRTLWASAGTARPPLGARSPGVRVPCVCGRPPRWSLFSWHLARHTLLWSP